ncbi:phage tail protein [Subsaximicrobium wynnwilliamsii]|uniref:Phage tail protein n=1 Tax=Subsaximicrobium wynnwilliamsii TaxID=291179 RepID=A0A5C6ZNB6_9FLAO|nr:phage tail protein [Subsaximicrobium wynnwilliamsii]TXD85072.1 phage tail protein [Subsaximicrobium wynnwilliamsii]TXD91115.1 phage tail protein [Subsaximicrobium wynnwilliamsii]TXE04509.1 phage tail protein [Subsaximicrobium wynnwilliamsii]
MKDFPLPNFHFRVDWGGTSIGFQEVSGLKKELEILEYREGSSPEYFKRKMPGMHTLSDISLKRGVFLNDDEFYKWYNTVALNTVEKRDIVISLLNEEHEPTLVWNVKECFITSIEFSSLNAEENGNAIDTMVLANHGFTVKYA